MAWTKQQLLERASRQLRDTEFSIYSKPLLNSGMMDAVDRIKQLVPELKAMPYLINDTDEVQLLPNEYNQLLWLMACVRAMEMDERNNEAARYRNEFEAILDKLVSSIADGSTVITDSNGDAIVANYVEDYVVDVKYNVYSENDELEPTM